MIVPYCVIQRPKLIISLPSSTCPHETGKSTEQGMWDIYFSLFFLGVIFLKFLLEFSCFAIPGGKVVNLPASARDTRDVGGSL